MNTLRAMCLPLDIPHSILDPGSPFEGFPMTVSVKAMPDDDFWWEVQSSWIASVVVLRAGSADTDLLALSVHESGCPRWEMFDLRRSRSVSKYAKHSSGESARTTGCTPCNGIFAC